MENYFMAAPGISDGKDVRLPFFIQHGKVGNHAGIKNPIENLDIMDSSFRESSYGGPIRRTRGQRMVQAFVSTCLRIPSISSNSR